MEASILQVLRFVSIRQPEVIHLCRDYSSMAHKKTGHITVITALAGQPPFNLPAELLYELSRLCLGDELAEAYALPRHRLWQQALKLYRTGNRISTLAHYHVPGVGRLSEKVNFHLLQKALHQNLDPNPDKRAFRHIA